MTPDELRALDFEIHTRVMGVKPREVRVRGSDETVTVWTDNPYYSDGACDKRELLATREHCLPAYSTDDDAAHRVVGQMSQWLFEAKWGFFDGVCVGDWQPIHASWTAAGWRVTFGEHSAACPTFAEAVCRAALKAFGVRA